MFMASLMIQTVKGCNLRCRYCYYEDRDMEIMPHETFKRILTNFIKRVREKDRKIRVIFHEGEPLLAGIEYYKKIIEIEKELSRKFNVEISNSMQTNAVLINKEWIKFFRKYKISVGVSIDGVKEAHDKVRIFPSGDGTFERALHGLRLLKKIQRVSVITVLNRHLVDKIEDVFFFAVQENVNIQISPVSPTENARKSKLTIEPHEYGEALCRIVDLVKLYNIRVNPIHRFVENLRLGRGTDCMTRGYSGAVGVDVEGNVYACHRMLENKRFLVGSYLENWFDDLKYEEFKSRPYVLRMGECFNCRFVNVCNGGCMANAYNAYGSPFRRDCFCEAYRMIYEELLKRFL